MSHRDLKNLVRESRKGLERFRALFELLEAVDELGDLENREREIAAAIDRMGDVLVAKENEANARLADLGEQESQARKRLDELVRTIERERGEAQGTVENATARASSIHREAEEAAAEITRKAEHAAEAIRAKAREEAQRVEGEITNARAILDGLNRGLAERRAELEGLDAKLEQARAAAREAAASVLGG